MHLSRSAELSPVGPVAGKPLSLLTFYSPSPVQFRVYTVTDALPQTGRCQVASGLMVHSSTGTISLEVTKKDLPKNTF